YQSNFRGLTDLVARYRSRFEALGDARRLSLLLLWEGFSHFHGARYEQARSVLERSLAIGESLGDEECFGYACMGLMFLYWLKRGDRPAAVGSQLGGRVRPGAGSPGDRARRGGASAVAEPGRPPHDPGRQGSRAVAHGSGARGRGDPS